jgi:Acyl-CoA reductase (LuxC)
VRALEAYQLPGLDESELTFEEQTFGDVVLRLPKLSASQLTRVAVAVLEAREDALAAAPLDAIVAAIDAAAARFADPADPLRHAAETALPSITGYHPAMVALVLDRMAEDWRAPALRTLLAADLDGGAALDGFVPRARGVRTRAYGPRLAFHVMAGNVPGVAVTGLIRSLLVRAATLAKTASGEPLLAPLFARALFEESPQLGRCIAAAYWPGGDRDLEERALAAADVAVVYGGAATLADLRARAPAHVRFLDHGPRISFAAVAREALHDDAAATATAAAAALAVATFDQQGCVSPHVLYVEAGGAVGARAFAALLAAAMARVEDRLPRGRIGAAESAAIQQARGAAEFGAFADRDAIVHAGPGTSYTVVYEADPALTASCLNRFIRVKPIDRLEALPALLAPHRDVLQSAGLAAPESRRASIAAALGAAGVSRVASLEALPWPPPAGHHDGRGPLAELVRWVDLEG